MKLITVFLRDVQKKQTETAVWYIHVQVFLKQKQHNTMCVFFSPLISQRDLYTETIMWLNRQVEIKQKWRGGGQPGRQRSWEALNAKLKHVHLLTSQVFFLMHIKGRRSLERSFYTGGQQWFDGWLCVYTTFQGLCDYMTPFLKSGHTARPLWIGINAGIFLKF